MNPYSVREKQAKALGRTLWSGLKRVNDATVWNGVKKISEGKTGKGWGALNSAANFMTSAPGKAIGWYGLAGLAVPSLPGAQLLQNVAMPGWAAAGMAENGIRSWRMRSPELQARMAEDARSGASAAGASFIQDVAQTPDVLDSSERYLHHLRSRGEKVDDINKFRSGGFTERKSNASGLFNAQGLFDNRAQLAAQELLNKSAAFGKLIDLASRAASKAGPIAGAGAHLAGLLGLGATGYGLYDAAFGSPYDRAAAAQTGYDAAQAGIANKLDKLPGWQKSLARMDPTLVAGEVDKKLPGSINAWQNGTGAVLRPGLLSSLITPGKPTFTTFEGQKI